MLIIMGDRRGEAERGRHQSQNSSTSDAEPHFIRTWESCGGFKASCCCKASTTLDLSKSNKTASLRRREERETEGEAVRGSEAGLGRWIWMLVRGSQTVRIKEKQ